MHNCKYTVACGVATDSANMAEPLKDSETTDLFTLFLLPEKLLFQDVRDSFQAIRRKRNDLIYGVQFNRQPSQGTVRAPVLRMSHSAFAQKQSSDHTLRQH